MLARLDIKNYALIDELSIQFDKGLNMITGETGAGKSIIMGALSLILGSRIEGKYFFNQDKKCSIEGLFQIEAYDLKKFFQDHDLDYEKETIIRREISVDGKSRAFVNDSPVTLAILKSLGEKLIDIHSQHATLQINTEEFQFLVVDNVAKASSLKENYLISFLSYRKVKSELKKIKELAKQAHAEADFNQFQFDELHQAQLLPDEQKELEAEQQQLENAEEIKRGLVAALHILEEQEQNVVLQLKESLGHLDTVSPYLTALPELTNRLRSVWIETKDIAAEVSHLEQETNLDQGKLTLINERLSLIYNLQKKHHVDTVEELLAIQEALEQKLMDVSSQDERIIVLEQELAETYQNTVNIGKELTTLRKKALPQIEKHVVSVLAEVGMPNAKLEIALQDLPDNEFKENGMNSIQFLFSANKGQELQAIHKVASGGELSRVMLAIKSLVAESSALPTIIFDEIDTGISGEVALKVGEIMERLSHNMQVIAISHLPQIASKGFAHFKVYKIDEGDKTKSNIVLLNQEERIKEIAQMLSGAKPTPAALEHAKALLNIVE
ncbi:DNA repair protein RecN [Sphingobacterium sp. SRCM116780]|uniref:DNA repair protein RecN n=1 Tax=Sphingobacterium sp. SRCM116780 TaxID=2907623 RepID=UPI001F016D97|nr:DNA repair protein RecN [Sphingobacterium sp. SRCM116780]UIR56598.1 DNA repair protein RecN [Sphingobacterium sp. SRCM116780]